MSEAIKISDVLRDAQWARGNPEKPLEQALFYCHDFRKELIHYTMVMPSALLPDPRAKKMNGHLSITRPGIVKSIDATIAACTKRDMDIIRTTEAILPTVIARSWNGYMRRLAEEYCRTWQRNH